MKKREAARAKLIYGTGFVPPYPDPNVSGRAAYDDHHAVLKIALQGLSNGTYKTRNAAAESLCDMLQGNSREAKAKRLNILIKKALESEKK